jgi:hypothetical protein
LSAEIKKKCRIIITEPVGCDKQIKRTNGQKHPSEAFLALLAVK